MPNLPAHADLALQVARRLDHAALGTYVGYFLLGSTAPDIRVITRKKREDYHFARLDFETVGSGMEQMFISNPHLVGSIQRKGPTQAFIAGYVTHLIADETWIVGMYRPFFGNREVFEDEVVGKVMDRAMQLELDRQAWPALPTARSALETATDGINVGFIPPDTLAHWRRSVISSFGRDFSWDRLRFMARRIAGGEDAHPAYGIAEDFVQAMPESLGRLHDLVPQRSLEQYKNRVIGVLVRVLQDYLR